MKLIPSSRRGALWRFALGALIVIAFTATTTAVAGLLKFKQAATYLSATPALPRAQVTIANPGDPQTLLLIGSDHRAGTPWKMANTDTMLLVRIDPNSSTINLLSLPRDLKVEIPGHGTWKLNEAYSLGGPNLLLRTIKQNVFPQLAVGHIIDVNFGGFEALVNAIGCVYSDVDHRYYNNTAVTNYSSIDIQPGYQKLCGPDALAFVRYRHTDSDIVRSARQQDFIRWAKDQYGTSQLVANRNKLLTIFGQHTQTDRDLHTVDALINLFNLVAFSAGHAIKQIAFPAILLPCNPAPTPRAQTPCYVGANPGAEQRALNQLMTPTLQQPSAPRGPRAPRAAPPPPPNVADLTPDVGDGKSQASSLGNVGMPVYFPRLLASGSSYCGISGTCPVGPGPGSYPRAYTLHDSNGT